MRKGRGIDHSWETRKYIGDVAFSSNQLTTLKNLPSSLTTIEVRAFNSNQVNDGSEYVYARNADGTIPLDWQGDIIRPDVLEKAAIDFMLHYRESGEMHRGSSKGTVVESIVLTKDKQAALGIPEGIVPEGWFITVKIEDPAVFERV